MVCTWRSRWHLVGGPHLVAHLRQLFASLASSPLAPSPLLEASLVRVCFTDSCGFLDLLLDFVVGEIVVMTLHYVMRILRKQAAEPNTTMRNRCHDTPLRDATCIAAAADAAPDYHERNLCQLHTFMRETNDIELERFLGMT